MGRDLARQEIERRMAEAHAGGAGASLAARRAAALAERVGDPATAIAALGLAARLEPLDSTPRLAAARLHAETGDLQAAAAESEAVLAESVDQAARARAAFMLGEFARARGEFDQARSRYETTLKIEDALLAADRSEPTAARWYARARGRIAELDAGAGLFERARAGAEAALALLRACAAQIGEPPALAADIADAEMRLGALELDDGQASSCLRRLNEAIGRFEALAVSEPEEPHWRAVLSDAWALAAEAELARGDHALARKAMDKALQARMRLAVKRPEEAWALAGLWRTRAALLAAMADPEGASTALQQARALAETLSAKGGGSAKRFLLHTMLDQADHGLRTGALAFAAETAEAARALAEHFVHQPEADPAWLGECGACWDRLGEASRLAREDARALEAFARAAHLRRLALQRDPKDGRLSRALAAALVKLGEAALAADAADAAREALDESVRLRLALAEAAPEDPVALSALATALERLGLAALACGDRHAARGAWEDELALAGRLFSPDDIQGQRFRAIVESHLAQMRDPDSETWRQSALARFDALAHAGMLTSAEAALRKKLWGG